MHVRQVRYRAILSRNFIARQSCSSRLCRSHTATLSHKQALANQIGQCLFMRQSRSVRPAQLRAAKLHENNRRCDIGQNIFVAGISEMQQYVNCNGATWSCTRVHGT